MLKNYINLRDPQEYTFLRAALTTRKTHMLGLIGLLHVMLASQPLVLVPLVFIFAAALIIDAKHMILPDILTISALILGLLLAPVSLTTSLVGAFTGFIFFALLEITMTRALGRPALGWGDVKLLAAIGAWGGVLALPLTLLISSITAVHFILYRRLKGDFSNQPLPFGPFLIVGGWLSITHGTQIWQILGP